MTDRERVVKLLRLHGDPTEVAALLGTDDDTIHAILRGDDGASLPASGGGGGGGGNLAADLTTNGIGVNLGAGTVDGNGDLTTPGVQLERGGDLPETGACLLQLSYYIPAVGDHLYVMLDNSDGSMMALYRSGPAGDSTDGWSDTLLIPANVDTAHVMLDGNARVTGGNIFPLV